MLDHILRRIQCFILGHAPHTQTNLHGVEGWSITTCDRCGAVLKAQAEWAAPVREDTQRYTSDLF